MELFKQQACRGPDHGIPSARRHSLWHICAEVDPCQPDQTGIDEQHHRRAAVAGTHPAWFTAALEVDVGDTGKKC